MKNFLSKIPKDFRNLSFLTSISFLSNIIGLVRNLILAIILGVNEFGFYVLYLTFASYLSYLADMGCNAGALRLIPFYRGKSDYSEEGRIFSDTFGITILQNFFWLCFFFLISLIFLDNLFIRNVLILLGIHAICSNSVNFLNLSARLRDKFYDIGSSNLLISIVPLFFLSLIYFAKFEVNFFVAGMINISGLFSCMIFLLYKETLRPQFKIKLYALKRLISSGLPLMVSSVVGIFMLTAERLVVAEFLDDKNFGFYGFATTFGGVVIVLSTTWSYLRTQIMIEAFSRESSIKIIVDKASKDLLFLVLLFTSVIPLVSLFINLIPIFLPQYSLAASSVLYHAMAAGYLAAWIIFNMVNIATNRIGLNIAFGTFFITIKLLIFYLFSHLNFQFEEFSLLNASFNFFIVSVVCTFYLFRNLSDKFLVSQLTLSLFFQALVSLVIVGSFLFFEISFIYNLILMILFTALPLLYLYKNLSYLISE